MKKKSRLFLLPLASLLLIASCDNDKEEDGPSLSQSEPYKAMMIVAAKDKDATVSMNTFKINFNLLKSVASVNCASLPVDGSTVSFETSAVPFNSWLENNYSVTTINTNGHVPLVSAGVKIENMNFYITNAIIDLSESKYAAPDISNSNVTRAACFVQFDLNSEYEVKGMPADICFKGSTVTTYPSKEDKDKEDSFENNAIKYRIVFDIDKKKADVVLYDAQFAPAPSPPLKGVILRDLDVKFTEDAGYVVSGENIKPFVMEGPSSATPNPKFSFNSFKLRSASPDLTKAEGEYTVATVYTGTFSGSAVLTSK